MSQILHSPDLPGQLLTDEHYVIVTSPYTVKASKRDVFVAMGITHTKNLGDIPCYGVAFLCPNTNAENSQSPPARLVYDLQIVEYAIQKQADIPKFVGELYDMGTNKLPGGVEWIGAPPMVALVNTNDGVIGPAIVEEFNSLQHVAARGLPVSIFGRSAVLKYLNWWSGYHRDGPGGDNIVPNLSERFKLPLGLALRNLVHDE